jgi:integrase
LGDIKDVAERLGHSDTRVTMHYYMAPSSARQRRLTERLADQRAAFRDRAATK